MKRKRWVVCVGVAGLLLTLPAFSQGNPTGKLTGRVSADGNALPGVTVEVTSPNLQGTRVATSSANGDYVFALLPPGEYEVTFRLEGFRTQKIKVLIPAAQTRFQDVELMLSEVSEEIVVTGNQETFSEASESSTTYQQELIERLALPRTLEGAARLAPGVQGTGPNNNISISGGQSYENLFKVNGVVVNENVRGQAISLFIEDAIQETTTTVSGVSAEYGRFTGGVVNTITKSGGNSVHGSLRVSLEKEVWSSETPVTLEQDNSLVDTYEGTLGGFFVKDRLWYFGAGRTFDRASAEQTFATNIPYTNQFEADRSEIKLTAGLTKRHSLLGSVIDIERDSINEDPFGIVLELAALGTRADTHELRTLNYTGLINNNFFVEAQVSEREFTIVSGGNERDFVKGTVLIDLENSAGTYHTPYFCGFCRPTERDNEATLVKGNYFLSTSRAGSHDIVFGFETFSDIVAEENHQSASGFQIWNDTTIQRGEGVNTTLFPVISPGIAFIIWFPIFNPTQGTDFQTDSFFINDAWALNDHWSFNLGVRYDENEGLNGGGELISSDNNVSPRFGVTYDLKGDGKWVFNASWGRYVAAVNSSIGDITSKAGGLADFEWDYQGPPINQDPNAPTSELIGQDEAIEIVFDWFNSVGGVDNRDLLFFQSVPGSSVQLRESLNSPNAEELTVGVTKRLGSRGLIRADYVRREFGDFYVEKLDRETGQAFDENLGDFDLGLLANNDDILERMYDGLHTQFNYRVSDTLGIGGNWTWSHARGNFEGEQFDTGPLTATETRYPEYKAFAQHNPKGDLNIDSRHKVRLWAIYDLIDSAHNHLDIGILHSFSSGTPYGARGEVDTRDIVGDLGYLTPPREVRYFFTARDAFHTDDINRTDLSLNYSFGWKAWGKEIQVFLQPEVLNVFDEDGVVTPFGEPAPFGVFDATNSGLAPFNPFTETPVQGVHWDLDEDFGKGLTEDSFQTPRTFRFSVGLRF